MSIYEAKYVREVADEVGGDNLKQAFDRMLVASQQGKDPLAHYSPALVERGLDRLLQEINQSK